MRGVLKPRSKVILSRVTSGNRDAVEAAIAPMNESCFEDEKQFPARFLRIAGEHVLQISTYPLFVSHPKPVSFAPEDHFGIATKDYPATCLRECEIEVRREPAIYRRQLLANKCRHINLSRRRSSLFPCR